MSELVLTLLLDLLSVAGLAGLSGGSRVKVRAALTPLAGALEVGVSRIPFGLTQLEADKFKADLRVLAELLANESIQRATIDTVDLNKLVAQLDQTVQTLSHLNHSEAFSVLTAIRDAKRSLAH